MGARIFARAKNSRKPARKTVRMRTVFREIPRFRGISRNREPAIFRGSFRKKSRVSRQTPRKSTIFYENPLAKNRPIFRERNREKPLRDFSRANFSENSRKFAKFREKRAHTLGRNLANFSQISTFQMFTPVGNFEPRPPSGKYPRPPKSPVTALAAPAAASASLRQGRWRLLLRKCLTAPRVRKLRFASPFPPLFRTCR